MFNVFNHILCFLIKNFSDICRILLNKSLLFLCSLKFLIGHILQSTWINHWVVWSIRQRICMTFIELAILQTQILFLLLNNLNKIIIFIKLWLDLLLQGHYLIKSLDQSYWNCFCFLIIKTFKNFWIVSIFLKEMSFFRNFFFKYF